MHHIKLTLAYDGTDFHGWQIQPGQPTIQGLLAEVLQQLTQERIVPYGAGRTDAGVHAWGQVANFSTRSVLTADDFARALNALLPPTIRIRAAEEVGPDFHARWLADAKTYIYRIYRGRVVPPFHWRYVLHDPYPLDFDAMAEAARAFAGQHDFTSFAASSGSDEIDQDRITMRTVYRSEMIACSREAPRPSAHSSIELPPAALPGPFLDPTNGRTQSAENLSCATWCARSSARFWKLAVAESRPPIFLASSNCATAHAPAPPCRRKACASSPSNIPTPPTRSRPSAIHEMLKCQLPLRKIGQRVQSPIQRRTTPMRILTAVTSLSCAFVLAVILYAQRPSAPVPASASVDAAACARLASLALPNSAVTSAQLVPAGKFAPPAGSADAYADLPAFCRVALTLKPSKDSDIKSETWLPISGWNGKFQEVGNGAWGGSIQYGALAEALRRGYAAASTDTGHTGTSASFAMGHPEKLLDFGYRAIHETAVQSKAVIAALYGVPPRLSYFTGCSGGGRQAFAQAQRFPQDFDGIIAGAPGYNRTDQSFQLVSITQATHIDKASWIPPEKYPALHRAALYACDALDGVADGLIGEPMRCRFDPAIIQCTGADGPNCLTLAQVQAAKKVYAAINDPKTGQEIFPGLEPGSELRWGGTSGGPRPLGMSDDLFKYVVFGDPNWDFLSLDLSKHLELARKIDGGNLSPTSPDIKRFVAHGGKLLMYHGWGDQNISPRSSVIYYNKLVNTLGKPPVDDAVRLYMVPGMGHCGGGEGPNVFDMLAKLEQWRENGAAPAEVIASKITEGKVVRTRPLCPYPQVAQYKGAGSIDQAQNFACLLP